MTRPLLCTVKYNIRPTHVRHGILTEWFDSSSHRKEKKGEVTRSHKKYNIYFAASDRKEIARNSERGLLAPSSRKHMSASRALRAFANAFFYYHINTRPEVSKTVVGGASSRQPKNSPHKNAGTDFAASGPKGKKHAIKSEVCLRQALKNVSTASIAGVCERD